MIFESILLSFLAITSLLTLRLYISLTHLKKNKQDFDQIIKTIDQSLDHFEKIIKNFKYNYHSDQDHFISLMDQGKILKDELNYLIKTSEAIIKNFPSKKFVESDIHVNQNIVKDALENVHEINIVENYQRVYLDQTKLDKIKDLR